MNLLLLLLLSFFSSCNQSLADVLQYYDFDELSADVNSIYGAYRCHEDPQPGYTFRTLLNTDLSHWNPNNDSLICRPKENPCELDRIYGSESDCICAGAYQGGIVVEEFPGHSGFNLTYDICDICNEPSYVAYKCLIEGNVTVVCDIPTNGDRVVMTINTPGACGHDLPPQPKEESFMSWGVIIFLIVIIIVGAYFLIGMPIMYFIFKKTGSEMLPFSHQIGGFFSYVSDGFQFLFKPCLPAKRSGFRAI